MSLQKESKKNLKKDQDSFVRGPDLDQNVTDPQHWFRIGSLLAGSGPVFVFYGFALEVGLLHRTEKLCRRFT